ncbi:hypothetical protein GCM10010112_82680 [Actinoplanes lobatus]|uniref:DUF4192 domain-containing protein n=1 Tax=Actinoplanes lobatus TaxID=113568 RepID=A0A7W7HL57_9ACTN|nr:DUF4192 domain-containing protein [Actinoplanes lobatus]MBB4752544.1 hypothetical protein [Actinoplanes lobatus]GGN93897.1 hypothetical protein GCM10010112_82680 [Actinoplanes lobatus]GIE44843.1 hypothetical protein Alo02nite_77410 [Actinoplanes lobatus]
MPEPVTLRLTEPADAAAIVPYLFGYHPNDAVAVLAMRDQQVVFIAALRLGEPADHLTRILADKHIATTLLVGYGAPGPVTATVDDLEHALTGIGITVIDVIHIHDGRLYHIGCPHHGHPANGIPYDPHTTAAAAHATYHGLTALPDRAALAAHLDPIGGAERDAMTAALTHAVTHLNTLIRRQQPDIARSELDTLLHTLIGEALATNADRGFPDDRAALLLHLLSVEQPRAIAARRVHGDDTHIQTWTALTRRADIHTASGPALLLAFAAIQAGRGALADIAATRARTADPGNQLAATLHQLIRAGAEPADIRRVLHD